MSEGSGYLPDVTDYFESDSAQAIDIGSFDIEYLATCVRFAQSHGIFPTSQGSQLDTSFSSGSPSAPPQPLDQDQGIIFDTHNLDPNLVDNAYPDPLIGNTSATRFDTQSNDGNNDDPQVGSIASQLYQAQNTRSLSPAWNDFMIFDEDQMEEVADPFPHHMSNPGASTTETVNRESALDVGPSRTLSPEEEDSDGQARSKKHGPAILHSYDPFWVQKTGVDPRTVFEPRSKMKFEKLFLDGVIQEGDCLVIAVTCSINQVVRPDSAIFTFTGVSKATDRPRDYPDLALTLRNDPAYEHTLLACKGIDTILATFDNLNITPSNPLSESIAGHLNVWRGDQRLGTFDYVRQAYTIWMNNISAANARVRTKERSRRIGTRKTAVADKKKRPRTEKQLKEFIDSLPDAEG